MSDFLSEQIKQQSIDHGPIGFFTRNPVSANLLMAIFLIGGVWFATNLNTEIFPTIKPGIIFVSVPYPGATPSEVEEGITRRVEEAVAGLEGVDRVQSVASENSGQITVELTDFADEREVLDDVQAAVDRIVDFPPLRAEEPQIEIAETTGNVMRLVIYGAVTEFELRQAAEYLQDALLNLENVSLVSLEGARPYELTIEVSDATLRQYSLTLNEVANTIRQSSMNLSAGEIKSNAGDLLIRTNKKLMTVAEFARIPIQALPNGTVLELGDIASLRDEFVEDRLISEYNGRPAIFLKVSKSESEDLLEIAKSIRTNLDDIDVPYDVSFEIFQDDSEVLKDRISLLVRNGILGFTLVVLFLLLMVDLKLAIWVAMGVPISFLGAMILFEPLDVDITMVSLFGLIMVLGVVVDDAIVVGENIGAVQASGLQGPPAAIAGAKGVFSPVFIGVLTTMAAFAPLAFATGTFGQILAAVPYVVISVLAISLIEVFLILPAHMSHPSKWSRWPLSAIQSKIASGVQWFRDGPLVQFTKTVIQHRYLTLFCGFLFIGLAVFLLASNKVRLDFFPNLESDSVSARLTYPIGTPFNTTEVGARQLRDAILAVNSKNGGNELSSINMVIGGTLSFGGGPTGGGGISQRSNVAQVSVVLADESIRNNSSEQVERLWRSEVGQIAGAELLSFESSFMGGSSNVAYELTHRDSDTLLEAVDSMKQLMSGISGLNQITDDYDLGKRQFDIELTPAGEAAGLTNGDIARQLRQSYFGEEIQRIQRNREEVKVMLRYPESERNSTREFANSRVRLADGTEVPLFTVARIVESRSFSSITRVDGRRVVAVSAKLDVKERTSNQIIAEINSVVLPSIQERFPRLSIREAGFAQAQSDDFTSLISLALASIVLIYILLASQLRRYTLPLVVLSAIPFGACGAIVGHFLLGFDMSFVSIFGIVALSGIVVNDSLVLTDLFVRLRAVGLPFEEAIVEAVRGRFRAVFLTTATTSLGLTPMLFETSLQAQFLVPMAVSLATGTVFASLTILFLVPSLVVIRRDFFKLLRIEDDTASIRRISSSDVAESVEETSADQAGKVSLQPVSQET